MPALDLSATSVDLTRTICDIPSVSGDETALADAIHAAVGALAHLEVYRDGDTIVARTDLGRAQRVAIAGHIDTVPINGNVPTRDIEIDGEPFLWGRGTVDMKAGVAVQLKLAAELADPRVDITWMWYDHEEVDADLNGLTRLARTRPDFFAADFAILGEPSERHRSRAAATAPCAPSCAPTACARTAPARGSARTPSTRRRPVLARLADVPAGRDRRRRARLPRGTQRRAHRRAGSRAT